MKIAIVYDAIYPYVKGGAEKRIYDVAKVLSKNHEVHLFGMKYWSGENILKSGDIYLHGVCNPISLYNKNGERSLVQPIYFSFYLFKTLKKFDFDLIECQNFPYLPCFVSKFYSIVRKKPLVIMWIEIWKDLWKKRRLLGYLGSMTEKMCFRLTKNNLVLTKETGERLGRKFTIFPVGIDLEKIKKCKAIEDKLDIIYVGRLIKDKKVDLLLRAVKDLNLKICVIGDGPERNKLIDLADELKLDVQFTGFLESDREVYSYMKSSKILVLPSIREGFGVVVLEGLACGCKIITTNHKDNNAKELVDENFVCNASMEGLREVIKSGLNNRYNNKIKLDEYDIKKVTEKIEKYYQGCINEN